MYANNDISKLYKDSNYVNFEFMRRFLASA